MGGRARLHDRGSLSAEVADLAIRGAVVVSDGAYERDVLIRDGRVVALVEAGAGSAAREIDASGLFALPGVVDAHVHFNDPGRAEWEGWEHGSAAAAAGGTTTVADMPLNSLPPVLDGVAFDAKRAAGERSSIVDFALWGGLVSADPAPLHELAERGAVGVKGFLCDPGVPEFFALDASALEPAMRAAANAGLLVALHCEDDAAVRAATELARTTGDRDAAAWLASRPPIAEARATAMACDAAKRSGARLHIVHLSSVAALGAVGNARNGGADVTVETCPHYFVFDARDVAAAGAQLKCAPPIRERENGDSLWRALLGGRIDFIASDHSPAPPAMKAGDDLFDAWGGINGVQSLLPAILTESIRRAAGAIEPRMIAGFVAWRLAVRPAQRLGLYPRKGSIAAGSDADIVLLDLDREWTFEARDARTRYGVTPYVGRTFRGAIVRTIVRGVTVYDNGEITAEPGHGRFVARA